MFVVGSLVVGIGGAMVLMSVRRQRELLAATPIRETLEEVLTETLDDLRREPDPRKAVIGAYSNMERTLAARGAPRHESEAPDEYLARILDVVGASGHSVRRLTRLFARARFSPHEIDATDEGGCNRRPHGPAGRAGGTAEASVLHVALYASLATIGLLVARMLAPGRHELALDIYVLTLGGVALLAVSSALGDVAPREDESLLEEAHGARAARAGADPGARPPRARAGAGREPDFDLHYRLRPVLREIAQSRLERRGVQLDSENPRVRELLGDELWALTAADREPSAYRQAPGLPLEDLERTVERLERL